MKPAEQTPLSALYMAALSKGQEISKRNFGVFKSSKNEWNLFKDFFFWFNLFLEARAEILKKTQFVFVEIWRYQNLLLKFPDL